ncbi:transposase [Actinocrinis puniceicyclus]|uniref:Transposase n=1 Tax=Actinocrinis puniceicyclus TaxID=977794 RepID=A0A8J7WSH1_9ACTN|nr:transposase [Actinocrinis puniceicyclus]
MRGVAERTLQELIEAEATARIGAGWNEHTQARTAYRNGHRDKTLTTLEEFTVWSLGAAPERWSRAVPARRSRQGWWCTAAGLPRWRSKRSSGRGRGGAVCVQLRRPRQ